MSKFEMEKYNAVKQVLLKEYRLDLEAIEDYREKFDEWKKAYPASIKDKIIESNDGDWSTISREFHRLFNDEVWVPYRDVVRQLRTEERKKMKGEFPKHN